QRHKSLHGGLSPRTFWTVHLIGGAYLPHLFILKGRRVSVALAAHSEPTKGGGSGGVPRSVGAGPRSRRRRDLHPPPPPAMQCRRRSRRTTTVQDKVKEKPKSKTANLIAGATGEWEVIVGMEVHAQVASKAKLFSG